MDGAGMPIADQMMRVGASRLVGRLRRLRFLRSERGMVAVDFALVVVPFIVVMMVIVESALVLFAGQALQTAANNAARTILTGQAQNAGYSAAQFKTNVCASLTVMFNCANNLYIDVRSFSNTSFSSVTVPSPTNTNGTLDTSSYGYSTGGPGDIVVVRLIYQWPIIAAKLGFCMQTACGLINSANNTSTLVATVAFQNEPYTSGT
jgi:Flp pilus assembly protein TadG